MKEAMDEGCAWCEARCTKQKDLKRFRSRHGDVCLKKAKQEFSKQLASDVKSVEEVSGEDE